MSELLPCPFCGGEAEILTAESMYGGNLYGVLCDCCAGRTDVFDTEAEAIAAWNSRAERTCFADEVTHRDCKYSVNRGWRERTCRIEERNGDLYCNACGEMVGTCDPASELYIDGNMVELWNYCPHCGARVVSE